MERRASEQIWCEDCACENAEDIIYGVNRGRSTAKGGTLKVSTRCSACDAPIAAGAYVEAITFHADREKDYRPWEERYIEVGIGLMSRPSEGVKDKARGA